MILLVAAALFLIGTNLQSGWLFVIIAFLIALVVYAFFSPLLALRGLSFKREISPEIFEGEPIPVRLKITNQSRKARYFFQVSDDFFAFGPEAEKIRYSVAWIKPGEQVAVKYKLVAVRRGIYTGGYISVSSAAPFGLVRLKKEIFAPSPVLVYPSYFEIGSFPILEAGSYPVEHFHEPKSKGFGQEYYGIREYRPGDSLRFIHWRSTAKSGQLVVREFEHEMATPVSLILDLEKGHSLGYEPGTSLEHMIKIAASVSRYSLRTGHPVQLIASPSTEVETLTAPDWWQALEWLAKLEANGEKQLSEVIEDTLHLMPLRSTAVVLLPSNFSPPLDAFRALQAKRVRIVAVVFNGASYDPRMEVGGQEEFARLVEELTAERVIVYPVNKGDDLRKCFSRSSAYIAG